MVVAFAGALALAMFSSAPALAQEADRTWDATDGAAPEASTGEWYGMPMLITDIAAAAVFAGGGAVSEYSSHKNLGDAIGYTALAAYLLNGPIVHLVAGRRIGVGFGSLGMRAGSPMVGLLTGFVIGSVTAKKTGSDCDDSGCNFRDAGIGAITGFLAGVVAAAVVDDLFLARKPVPSQRVALVVAPFYQPATRQMSLTLQGAW